MNGMFLGRRGYKIQYRLLVQQYRDFAQAGITFTKKYHRHRYGDGSPVPG